MRVLFLILSLLGLVTYGDSQRSTGPSRRTASRPASHGQRVISPADFVTISEDGTPPPPRK